MACRLDGDKLLSEPMLTYCQLDPKEHISMKFCLKFKYFVQENAFEHVVPEMVAILTQEDHIWLPPISWHIIREGASRSAYNASKIQILNTLRLRRNVRLFRDGLFKCIFLNENVGLSIEISLKFVPEGSVNNISPFIHIMAWHWSNYNRLSMIIS